MGFSLLIQSYRCSPCFGAIVAQREDIWASALISTGIGFRDPSIFSVSQSRVRVKAYFIRKLGGQGVLGHFFPPGNEKRVSGMRKGYRESFVVQN